MSHVSVFPLFIPLFDDDIVSLTALMLIVDSECRDNYSCCVITQLTLSLYLMTQCQLKLRHSVTSLAQTLDHIEVLQRSFAANDILDRLTLTLTERKILIYLSSIM